MRNLGQFFFDTADTDYIKRTWDILNRDGVSASQIAGITTNPNAFSKCGLRTLSEWENRTLELSNLLAEICSRKTLLYVQVPNTKMTSREMIMFSRLVGDWSASTLVTIGTKIPPGTEILTDLESVVAPNVTGVADAGTALFADSFVPTYVSMIVGRMEEVGIDAKAHVQYYKSAMHHADIIAGSMRTLEGLRWTIEYGTVPTIGTRVWDLIVNGNVNRFTDMWGTEVDVQSDVPVMLCPIVDHRNTELSIDFFGQMNTLGETAYQDFLKLKVYMHR